MGYNSIANKYAGASYDNSNDCLCAIQELEGEQRRLNEELEQLKELRQNYEENVYPHLRRANSRTDKNSRAIYNNALNTLLDAEKSNTVESERLQDKVKRISGEIDKRVSEIQNMEGIVEGNIAKINNRVTRYNIELNEVLQQIVSIKNQYRKLSN